MKSISTKITNVLKNNNIIEICLKILATLTIIGTTLYGVDELLASLFDSLLGNILLVVFIGFIGLNNIILGVFSGVLFIMGYIYYITILKPEITKTEGFDWSQSNIDNFVKVQKTANPRHQYNITTLQKHVTNDEVTDYLANGKWPWSKETQKAYESALTRNPYVRLYKTDGLNQAQQVYNEYAIKYILDNQVSNITKNTPNKDVSGPDKLPSGWGSFGYNSGLI